MIAPGDRRSPEDPWRAYNAPFAQIVRAHPVFDTAELGQSISKSDFKKRENELRARLLKLQYQALEMARFPIIIDFAGVDGAGKGTTMNMLDKWMDPRWIRAIGYQPPSDEERARPRFWRY